MFRLTTPAATLWLMLASLGAGACGKKSGEPPAPADAAEVRDPVTGLTVVEAAEVLATVGDRSITLGDYAFSLARMDEFERLRYQSEDRQKELLSEMIQMEVLAQEARRRGLDKDPEVQLRLMQALRNELLDDLSRKLPALDQIPETAVRDYYQKHQAEFVEPLRHRVLVIELADAALAQSVATQAQGASGAKWAELARAHSLRRDRLGAEDANELAGDLGFVSAPGQRRGEKSDVPESVRAAVFQLRKVGDVATEPAQEAGRFYVVRLGAISPARDRSLIDAGPAIRAELRRLQFAQAEKELLAELERRYPAKIDDAALARVVQGAP